MSQWHTGGYASRDGLSARNHLLGGADQVQLNMDGEFDQDREIDGLRSQIGRLKEVSKAIHEEAKEQSKLAEALQEALDQGRFALKKASKRLNLVYDKARSNHLVYLVLFAFAVVMGVWFLAKVAHVTRMVSGG
ncbi:hypothetical protein BSKO_10714 [Bryopsis sp. KO-2023]|nr:hypothetical protein BSKO_10714 [Bryopsis sp. KO-2023]